METKEPKETKVIEVDLGELVERLRMLAHSLGSVANRELMDVLSESLDGMVKIAVRGRGDVGGYAAMAAALAGALADGLECIRTYMPSSQLSEQTAVVVIPVLSSELRKIPCVGEELGEESEGE